MKQINISELIPDSQNANKGTERGMAFLENSLQKYGAGRSILLDCNNNIIAGNKTVEMAGQVGIENVRVIETDGNEIVAVKRVDLDLNKDTKARELAYADNRVAEVDLKWDYDQILKDSEVLPIEDWFSKEELGKMYNEVNFDTLNPEDIKEKELDENIKTNCECPQCGYKW